jgi:hypothetical protein
MIARTTALASWAAALEGPAAIALSAVFRPAGASLLRACARARVASVSGVGCLVEVAELRLEVAQSHLAFAAGRLGGGFLQRLHRLLGLALGHLVLGLGHGIVELLVGSGRRSDEAEQGDRREHKLH